MITPEAPRHEIVGGIAGRLPLLIIDDDAAQRALIRRAAEKCHYVATEAASFREGFARLKGESFACVTLDLKLGDGDGTDILEAMADLNYVGSVIVISGMTSGQRTAAREAGRSRGILPSHILRKPIDLAALRIALAQLRCRILGLPMVQNWGEVRGTAEEVPVR
jgi:two-component system chemotaxis response regulator CheY